MMNRLIFLLTAASKYLLPLWAVLIIVSSTIPGIGTAKIDTGGTEIRLDYLFHFIVYAVLAFLAVLYFIPVPSFTGLMRPTFTGAALLIFAMANEFIQLLIPGRSYNPADLASNAAGVISGFTITLLITRNIKRN